MILKHTSLTLLFILFFCGISFADNKFNEIEVLYQKSLTFYKQKKYYKATKPLNGFFKKHDFKKIDPNNKQSKYTAFLNDYAFFLQKAFDHEIYETQTVCNDIVAEQKAGSRATIQYVEQRRKRTFRQIIELLSYVISREPKRTVAYLNLADAYHEISKFDEADSNYKIYAKLMNQKGKSKRIPARVYSEDDRDKELPCDF